MAPGSLLPALLLAALAAAAQAGAAADVSADAPRPRLRKRSLQSSACDGSVISFFGEASFNALAPAPDPLYTYDSFCTAVKNWNAAPANAGNQIFAGPTELGRRNELAAFLGHTLHETGSYQFTRETSQCGATADDAGTLYCQPDGFSGAGSRDDPYCAGSLNPTTTPDGCACSTVPETSPFGYEANLNFFGRGPIQLSWNYNYIDAGAALGMDLCAEPELVATDSAVAWGTAIWFWTTSTGAASTDFAPTTPSDFASAGSFGGSLFVINGGLECPTPFLCSGPTYSSDGLGGVNCAPNAGYPASDGAKQATVGRLDNYCGAITELGAEALGFDECFDLQTLYDSCVSGGSGVWGACPACDAISRAPTQSPVPAVPTASPTTSAPTTSPSAGPTSSPAPCPFYWNGDLCVQGCDGWGDQFSSLEGCCTDRTDYEKCIGATGSPTISPTTAPPTLVSDCPFYTNGDLCVQGCNGWGEQYESLDACCAGASYWKTEAECLGVTESPTVSPSTAPPTLPGSTKAPSPCLYYTNTVTCVNDCGQGDDPSWPPLYEDLQQCCDKHHFWPGLNGIEQCLGLTDAPTATPTTGAPQVCQFYTDWSGTCRSDCNEQSQTLYASLDLCCRNEYTWAGAYETCMGITDAPTISPTTANPTHLSDCPFYSNGDLCVQGCNGWGVEYDSLAACCASAVYSKTLDECLGVSGSPTTSPTASLPAPPGPNTPEPTKAPSPCLYYTNMVTCVNDCGQGDDPSWPPLYEELEQCCDKHHFWAGANGIEQCLGLTGAPTTTPTTGAPQVCQFYTDWSGTCRSDCNEQSQTIYASLDLCCENEYTWTGAYETCMGITDAPTISPTTAPPTLLSDCPFYSDGNLCVQGCNGWGVEYDSLELCCNGAAYWKTLDECLGLTGSPTISPTTAPPAPPGSTPAPAPCQYYTDYQKTCKNDCEEGLWPPPLYDTLEQCCSFHHSNAKELCLQGPSASEA